jgi:ABC-type transporter MlaC component
MTIALATMFAALSSSLSLGAAPPQPSEALDRSKAVVQAFVGVPAKAGPARTQAFAKLDGFLDLDGMVAAAIAPRKEKLSAAEHARFEKRFRELLRMVAYEDSGAFFRRAKLTWGTPTVKGEVASVPCKVEVPAEDLETALDFKWQRIGGALRIVDVAFEGDSLVKDYQNQIARLVDKQGGAGLVKVLDDKYAQLTAGAAK